MAGEKKDEVKIGVGLRMYPSIYELCKEAAWRERTSFSSYTEKALKKLMKEQGYWPGTAGEQPGPTATP